MQNRPPPPPAKGTRHPGAGRKPGTPNRLTVAFHALIDQLVNDPAYQHKLRRDFRARKVHPTVEALVWAYHAGRPATQIELSGTLELAHAFDEERQKLRRLGLAELEQLAAQSQALVDQAFERVTGGRLLPESVIEGTFAPESSTLSEDMHKLSDDTGSDNS